MRIYKRVNNMETNESIITPIASRMGTNAYDETENNFAFLVHSQDSLSQKIPPSIDNQRLARQKRRRTRYVANITWIDLC